MKIAGLFVALFAAALLALPVEAQQCGTVRSVYRAPVYQASVYATPTYVAPTYNQVVVTQFLAVPVVVPAYSIGYSPAGQGQDSQQLQLDILKLRLELEKLKSAPNVQQLQQPKTQQQPQNPPMPPVQNGLSDGAKLMSVKCASCHDAGVSKTKGGGLTLTQGGQLLPMPGVVQAKVMLEVFQGRMPPNTKLTDEEVGILFAYLDKK